MHCGMHAPCGMHAQTCQGQCCAASHASVPVGSLMLLPPFKGSMAHMVPLGVLPLLLCKVVYGSENSTASTLLYAYGCV